MKTTTPKQMHGGLVWILSGLALLVYGFLGLMNSNVPGVEEIVDFINSADGAYLYLAAFIAIFIEGLYFLGSFFPGNTFVVLIAVVAQAGGPKQFLGIIGVIYIGWILAGICNVLGAKYFLKQLHTIRTPKTQLTHRAATTWFPAFRATTEVAQIAEGHAATEVIYSSVRVKSFACLGAAVYALLLPHFIDIHELDNTEGFWLLGAIALISLTIGSYKIWGNK